jgi:hypothetical protein
MTDNDTQHPTREITPPPTRFPLGQTVITAGADAALAPDDVRRALARHSAGDWGDDLGPEDREENETALAEGFRLLSAYTSTDGTRFWVITEADRSVTTVLLPEEY